MISSNLVRIRSLRDTVLYGAPSFRNTGEMFAGPPVRDKTTGRARVNGFLVAESMMIMILASRLLVAVKLRSPFAAVRRASFAAAAMALAGILTPLMAATPKIGSAYLTPTTVTVNAPATVTLNVSIPDPSLIPGSVNLIRVNANGTTSILGQFHDDGKNGDLVAGDTIFTIQITLNEPKVGQVELEVSAAFRGTLRRVQSAFIPIFVQPANAADLAITGLAAALAKGNVNAATQFFSDPMMHPKACNSGHIWTGGAFRSFCGG